MLSESLLGIYVPIRVINGNQFNLTASIFSVIPGIVAYVKVWMEQHVNIQVQSMISFK